jgi:hypothetical protein
MEGKEVDGQREEKDMVKRKNDQEEYLLNHSIPIHSPKLSITATTSLASATTL